MITHANGYTRMPPVALNYRVSGLTGLACILLLRSEHLLRPRNANCLGLPRLPPAKASTASGTWMISREHGDSEARSHAGLARWMQLLLLFRL